MQYLKNKKGVTELISFVLITLLVVISSTSAYFFSKSYMDSDLQILDRDNFNLFFKKFELKTLKIQNFDRSMTSIDIYFSKGKLFFKGNQIYYNSLVKINGNGFCMDNLCSQNIGGFERVSLNLSNSYTFENNFSLTPGRYIIIMENIKNESKIRVTFK